MDSARTLHEDTCLRTLKDVVQMIRTQDRDPEAIISWVEYAARQIQNQVLLREERV